MAIPKNALAAALSLATTLPLAPLASATEVSVLYPSPATNDNLAIGDYVIGGAHPPEQTFLDEFKFSLSSNSDLSISVNNIASPDTAPTPSPSGSLNLFDNRFLTFSLFDNSGKYLGSGADGSSLSLSDLASGMPYTLTVSGKSAGIFGGQYQGDLHVAMAAPLGATLPMFSAALLTLCVRRRRTSID